MSVKFMLQFKDQKGEPLKHKQVSAVNYSNILSTPEMCITDDKGRAYFSFFSWYKSIKIQVYFEYYKLPQKTINKDDRLIFIVPQNYTQAI